MYIIRCRLDWDSRSKTLLPSQPPMPTAIKPHANALMTLGVTIPLPYLNVVITMFPKKKYIWDSAKYSSLVLLAVRKYNTAGGPCIPKNPPIRPDRLPIPICVGILLLSFMCARRNKK